MAGFCCALGAGRRLVGVRVCGSMAASDTTIGSINDRIRPSTRIVSSLSTRANNESSFLAKAQSKTRRRSPRFALLRENYFKNKNSLNYSLRPKYRRNDV